MLVHNSKYLIINNIIRNKIGYDYNYEHQSDHNSEIIQKTFCVLEYMLHPLGLRNNPNLLHT